MNKRFLVPLLFLISIFFISCQNYTARDRKQELLIPMPVSESIETRYSVIETQRLEKEAVEAQKLAQQELEREHERLQSEAENKLKEAQKQAESKESALAQAYDDIAMLQKEKAELNALITQVQQQILAVTEEAARREKSLEADYLANLTELQQQLHQKEQAIERAKASASEIEAVLSEQVLLLALDVSQHQEQLFALQEISALAKSEAHEKETALLLQIEKLQSALDERNAALYSSANAYLEREAELLLQVSELETIVLGLKDEHVETQAHLQDQITRREAEISRLYEALIRLEAEKNAHEADHLQQMLQLEQQLHETEDLLQAEQSNTTKLQTELSARNEAFSSLQRNFNTLQNQAVALQDAFDHAQASYEQKIQEIEQRTKEQESLLNATEAEAFQRYKDLEAAYQEGYAAYQELENSYEQLLYQAQELKTLLEEQQLMYQELEEQLIITKDKNQEQLEIMISEHETLLGSLEVLNQQLEDENRLLRIQLEEKTLTLEEKLSLERMRQEEALRLDEERRKAQQALQEQLEMASAIERERRAALEAEWKQIPPLEELTFPRKYTTEAPLLLFKDTDQLRVMLLPLSDQKWERASMAQDVHLSVKDLAYPVLFVTGHMQNVIDLVREMRLNATLVEGGAIITSFPVIEEDRYGVRVQFSEKKTIRLSLANLVEHAVFEAFLANEDWQAVQKEINPPRQQILSEILRQGSLTEPTILGASLYEPSYQDWSIFSPIKYRQIDYLWPLSAFIEDSQFFDTYRMTHFSYATNSGNTYVTGKLQERFDYLFSRKVLPLSSSMLTIGGESVANTQGVSRYGLLASFLVP